jgi:Protein of unknown function (DUF2752)
VPFLRISGATGFRETAAIDRGLGVVRRVACLLLPALLASVRDRRLQGGRVEVSVVPHQARLMHHGIRGVALSAFLLYLAWNAMWIAKGRIPPSILVAIAGIPCPTTGGTRSVLALCHGEWRQAFLYNPLTLVYLVLFAYSVATLSRQMLAGKRLALQRFTAWMWMTSLAVGWVAKFALGREYW